MSEFTPQPVEKTSGLSGGNVRDIPSGSGLNGGMILHEEFTPAIKSAAVQKLSRPSLSYWQDAWIRLKKNRQALVSLGVVIALILFTLLGPLMYTRDPAAQDLARVSEAPSWKRTAVVAEELAVFEPVVLEGVEPFPTADSTTLNAPTAIEVIGQPSEQAVRLKWTPVGGAAGYAVYRSDREPSAYSNLGVPIGSTEAGNEVSYEDTFDIKPKTYYYSIVPKNGDESNSYVTLRVDVPSTISLMDAQAIRPDAEVGQTIELPSYPLGTDYLGRDMLARLMEGARVSLFIGFFAPFLAILLGVAIGGVAGYAGGRIDHYLMRFTDFVLALPFLLFMILFKVAFGVQAGESGIYPMLLAMVLLSWTGSARLIRGQVLQLRESEFVQAARLLGAKPYYLILRHLLPNTLGVILVSLTFAIPSAIFTEAFLSFIGMGVVPPTPSWGSMCNDGIQTFLTHPHEFLFPAFFISITVLAFNLLGDGLRDALDPRMRSVQ